MSETDEFEILKTCFARYGWDWMDFPDKSITCKRKGNMYLYNYNDFGDVPRDHPVLVKCRGLVVNEDGKILNYPFERFFNEFEKEAIKIQWESAHVQEKLDGSLICVFWNGKDWEVTTRGSFYDDTLDKSMRFDKWFKEIFDKFEELSKEYCYMFELCTKKNRIVTKYEEEFVALLGVRSLKTHKELLPYSVGDIASKLGVEAPVTYPVNSMRINEIKERLSERADDFEGFVVVDLLGNRIKIKSDRYMNLARIKELKQKEIFEYILGRLEIDQEYLHVFPEVEQEIKRMKKIWEDYKVQIRETFDKIKSRQTRKEFALEAIKYPYKNFLFCLYDSKDLDVSATFSSVEKIFCNGKEHICEGCYNDRE